MARQEMPPGAAGSLHAARLTLVALVADLRTELAGIDESTALVPDDEHDAEGSTVGYERARVGGLLRRAERDLAEVESAVARVVAGAYGTCEACGDPIGEDRLGALPAARRCVHCAAAQGSPGPAVVQARGGIHGSLCNTPKGNRPAARTVRSDESSNERETDDHDRGPPGAR